MQSLNKPNDMRLDALDGMRGLAIGAVFLSHTEIPYHFLPEPVPSWLSLILNQTVLGSGFLGVSILFVLSGFLMAHLYPDPKDKLAFIQKRYTRIFPLFITLSLVTLFFSLVPHMPWYLIIITLVTAALFVHIIWVFGIRKIKWKPLSKIIFLLFLFLQLIIVFAVPHVDKETFLTMPSYLQLVLAGLVSSTLTFPLAGAIPIVSTLYWTLAVEVLFYILYPTVFAPLINSRLLQTKVRKFLFFLLLMPLSYAVYVLTFDMQWLKYIYLYVIFHFVVGIILAYLYRHHKKVFQKLDKIFSKKFYPMPIVFLLLDFMMYHAFVNMFPEQKALIQLISAVPLGFVMAFALNKHTSLARFLSSKFLVFVGMISYSIYLCHLIILSLLHSVFTPTTSKDFVQVSQELIFVVVAAAGTIVISYILFYLLEKPYFSRKTV